MKPRDVALLLFAVLLFSGNFIASEYSLIELPPFFYTALRFILVGVLLLPFIRRPGKYWRILLLYSALATVHFSTGVGGLHYGLDVSANIIVSQLGVPIACLLGAIFLGEHFGKWRAMGMVISFGGMVLVAGTPQVGEHWGAFIMALAGALTGGISSLMMKQMQGLRFVSMMGWTAILATPQLLVVSYVFEHKQVESLIHLSPVATGAILYTVLISNLGALGIWFRMLHQYSVNQVAPFGLLTPFFGILMAQVFFQEELTWQLLLGGLLTVGGVAIITFRKPRQAAYKEL